MKSKIFFVSLELICGFGFALLGSDFYSLFDEANLDTSIFNTYAIAFISMVLGIGFAGYFHFRAKKKLNQFGAAVGLSIVGLFLFLILYFILVAFSFELIPYYFSSVVLPIVMPLCGAVIGFNFRIRNRNQDHSEQH